MTTSIISWVVLPVLAALLTVDVGCCDHCADLISLAVSRNGKLVASACGEYRACVWDASTGTLLGQIVDSEKPAFESVALSPSSDVLATGHNAEITLWDWRTGKRLGVLQNDQGILFLFSMKFSPNGEEIAAAGGGWPVSIWNVKTGELIHHLPESGMPYQHCWWQDSPVTGGAMPASISQDWDKTCLAYSLAYAPDGNTIAVGSKLWLRAWDKTTGAMTRTYAGAAEIGNIAFSPDSRLLGSSQEDGSIAIWDASTGGRLRVFLVSHRPLRGIAFSPDSRILAASGWDGNIYLCDVQSGALIRKITASVGAVNWVFFSPNGAELISGGRDDNLITTWEVASGRQLRQIWCLSVFHGYFPLRPDHPDQARRR